MYVVNAPNPSCCSNLHVLCGNCAAAAHYDHQHQPQGRPEPLPVTNWDALYAGDVVFEEGEAAAPQHESASLTLNEGKPVPLGLPVWEF